MKRSLLAFLVASSFVVACKQDKTAPPPPKPEAPSAQDAEVFAKQFAKKMAPCDAAAVEKDFASDVMIARAVGGRTVPRRQIDQLEREMGGKLGTMLCTQLNADTYTYLRMQTIEGTPRPLFRVLGDAGVNYHELELGKRDGKLAIVDVYIYMTGERLSDTFGSLIDMLLASPEVMEASLTMNRIRALMQSGDFKQAHALMQNLPAKLRNSKPIMLIGVQITSSLEDEQAYVKSIDAYAKAFPNDPSLDLIQIDGALLKKKYAEVLQILDRLDKRLGGDPYLDVLRSTTLADSGKLDDAVAYAKKATQREPTLEIAHWQLLTVQAAAKQYTDALGTLAVLRDKFGANVDAEALRSDERFIRLAASKEYAAWAKAGTASTKTP